MTNNQTNWARDVFEALAALDIRQAAYVPDGGLADLIRWSIEDGRINAVPLTTEEEGVAVLAGAWLGGERGVLMMQSSGVGNCVNALSMVRTCRFPLLVIVTMRGGANEGNPWQAPMGSITGKVFELCGVRAHLVEDPAEAGQMVAEAGRAAFDEAQARAVLIGQDVVGAKAFGD